MEELRNLQEMASVAANRFEQYDRKDFVLPQLFKEQVKEISSNTVIYNKYSAVIENRGNQCIFMPNQWFYIASYFTDLYNELQRYRDYALSIFSRERLRNLNGLELSENEKLQIDRLQLSETSKEYLVKFITDYSWWGGAKTIDRNDFFVSPVLAHAQLVNASQSFVAELCAFLADKKDLVNLIISSEESDTECSNGKTSDNSRQIIYYGAPGTGKSHEVKMTTGECDDEERDNVFRTTFHPDTDYASFVGCYKPTMRDTGQVRIVDGKTEKVEEISYEFVPQTFTDAYVYAYLNPDIDTFLVIEEINRGNCAQVFGDLFQLLDRKEDGTSEYSIKADTDLAKHLIKEGVASGDAKDVKLCLPANLHILATMNTSDQSLFPMDSAFKRRWDWEYVPISYTEEKSSAFEIEIGREKYSWVKFIEAVNKRIFELTQSEDKEMGNFFIKSSVDERQFKSKVMFYLWNEVLRDEMENQKYFFYAMDEDGPKRKFTFKDLYGDEATKLLQGFIRFLTADSAD